MTAWTIDDALLLLCIGDGGRRGATPTRILKSADARNRGYPIGAEGASIVGALIASGLVEGHDDRYRVTAEGRRIVRSASGHLVHQSTSLLAPLSEVTRVEGSSVDVQVDDHGFFGA